MSYIDIYTHSQRKLSFLLMGMAVLSVFSFSVFLFGTTTAPSRASKKTLLQHEVTNVYPTQASIFWHSEKKEVGWIVIGTKETHISTIVLDERDVAENKTSSLYHLVPLKNLEPGKKYYYKIVSGNEIVAQTNGKPFSFQTPSINASVEQEKPSYGKFVLPNGQAAQNAVVLLYYPHAYPLVTLTKATGEWLIPLQTVINKSTMQPVSVVEKEIIKLEVYLDDYSVTVISLPLKKVIPLTQTIIIGKEYDLTSKSDVLSSFTDTPTKKYSKIDIIFPKEKAVIPAVKPLFKGTAIAGKEVTLSVNSRPGFTHNLTVDVNGEWKLTVPYALLPGSYVLRVNTEDEKGKKVELTRNFTVAKSGEQVLGDATASGKVIPTLIAVASTPTMGLTATIAPTSLPNTNYATPTMSPSPSILLDSGFSPNFFLFASIAMIIVGAGFLIVF